VRDDAGTILGAVTFFHEIKERGEARHVPVAHAARSDFDDIIGSSPAMQTAKEWGALAAACSSTVLLLGESGTGKEIFARAIHNASARSRAPFLAINCAALPETLIESELFGYADGSFTGARKGGQAGKFELANGGTVFLDEIGEMSGAMQAKLLRVLQERTIQRVGSSREIPVDIRIIAATHRDLTREVEAGRFREDLYYRVAVLEVRIPALRERREDIAPLAACLLRRITLRLERPPVEITEDCLAHLAGFSWPGNVRQLENVLERAVVALRGGSLLQAEGIHLPPAMQRFTGEAAAPAAPAPVPISAPAAQSLRDLERSAIAEALAACGGNIKKAAQQLGIARNTLYRKMEDYQLVSPSSSK
jgi:transcriptional regulator with PAS, ATPase and Fis domain